MTQCVVFYRAASEKEPVPGTSGVLTSTPATTTHLFHMGHPTPGMSEISAAESERYEDLSFECKGAINVN